jgi:hypothetical protein
VQTAVCKRVRNRHIRHHNVKILQKIRWTRFEMVCRLSLLCRDCIFNRRVVRILWRVQHSSIHIKVRIVITLIINVIHYMKVIPSKHSTMQSEGINPHLHHSTNSH